MSGYSGYVNYRGEPLDLAALRQRSPRLPGQRKPTVPAGYAAPPGTGPQGETCRTCQFKHSMTNTGSKHWIKCDRAAAKWTHGEGTDIRASAPACQFWQPKAGK